MKVSGGKMWLCLISTFTYSRFFLERLLVTFFFFGRRGGCFLDVKVALFLNSV